MPDRYYMFGHDEETGIENENWSSLSAGMLTLFTYVTVRNTHMSHILSFAKSILSVLKNNRN